MKTPNIKVSFRDDMGCFVAEDREEGFRAAFGKTPEEAMARLALATALWADCEECRADGRIQTSSGDYRSRRR